MSSAPAVFDPSNLQQIAEEFSANDVVETSDFDDANLIPVGRYISTFRTLVDVKKDLDKNQKEVAKITIALTSGVVAESGATFGGGKYPLKTWMNSTLFSYEGQTGSTSSLSQYLKACGIDTKGKTVPEMVALLGETLTVPVYVRIERTDKAIKNEVTGKYDNLNLKTRDFLTGQDAEGNNIYASSIVKDGVLVAGKAKVGNFSRIK